MPEIKSISWRYRFGERVNDIIATLKFQEMKPDQLHEVCEKGFV